MDENVINLYLQGLEGKFHHIACKMLANGASFEEVYRHISTLRHPERKKIVQTRKLTPEEGLYLKSLDRDLRKQAYEALMKNSSLLRVQKLVKEKLNAREVLSLKRETILQMEKLISQMQKYRMQVPLAYYEVLFDYSVFGEKEDEEKNYELLGKMALIMLNTYDKNGKGEYYREIRHFMFNKIDEAFARGIIPHPLMFDYMLKGDWISENTFMVLHFHAEELIERGMGGMLALPLEKMYEKRKKDEDPRHPFSKREEHYFISLINLFKKG